MTAAIWLLSRMASSSQLNEADLRSGPNSYESLVSWADQHVSRLCEIPAVAECLAANLQQAQVWLSTDYSGKGCVEMAWSLVIDALKSSGHMTEEAAGRWQVWRACEIDEACRSVLGSYSEGHGPKHIMIDICDRMGDKMKMRITELLEMYLVQAEELKDATKEAGRKRREQGEDDKVSVLQSKLRRLGEDFMRDSHELLCNHGAWKQMQWCTKCKRECELHPPDYNDGLYMVAAGYCCQPWSMMGTRSGWLCKASVAWLSWCYNLLAVKPHVILGECTKYFDYGTMKAILEPIYIVNMCSFSPLDMGVPTARVRQYVVALRKDCMHSSLPFNMETFAAYFQATLVIDGSVFFRSPQSRLQTVKESWCRKKAFMPSEVSWDDLLSGAAKVRLEEYTKSAQEARLDFIVVDLNQRPSYMRAQSHCPTLLRQGCMWGRSLRVNGRRPAIDRAMLVEELLATECLPIFMKATHRLTKILPRLLTFAAVAGYDKAGLSQNTYKSMAGNGMVLPQVGFPLLVVMIGSCRRHPLGDLK